MKIYFYLVLLILTLISGCCMDSDLSKPSIPKIKRYTQADYLVSPDQRIVIGKQIETEWWSLFANKDLNQTIVLAVKDNYTVAAAKQSLVQAEQSVKSLRGTLWPQLNLLANAGRQKYGVALFGPVNFRIPPFTYYELGPAASWNVDVFGKTRYAIQAQEALVQHQMQNLQAVYLTLTSNVVAQALEIASVRAEIVATQKIILEDQKTLTLVQEAYSIGTHSKMDILNSKIQLDNDSALLPPLQQRLDAARHAMAILVGKTPADWSVPEFDLESFTLPQEVPVTIPSELVHKRPDILAAESNLQAACAGIGLADANFFPTILLTANTLQEALTPGGLFKAINNAFALAANITAPLFTGGTLTAEKRRAESSYKEMLAQYQHTILASFQDVADALTALAHDAELIYAQSQAVEAAKENLALSYKSYKAGTIGLIKIQDDQRELARLEISLIQAKSQRLLDTAKLFVAMGGSPFAGVSI